MFVRSPGSDLPCELIQPRVWLPRCGQNLCLHPHLGHDHLLPGTFHQWCFGLPLSTQTGALSVVTFERQEYAAWHMIGAAKHNRCAPIRQFSQERR